MSDSSSLQLTPQHLEFITSISTRPHPGRLPAADTIVQDRTGQAFHVLERGLDVYDPYTRSFYGYGGSDVPTSSDLAIKDGHVIHRSDPTHDPSLCLFTTSVRFRIPVQGDSDARRSGSVSIDFDGIPFRNRSLRAHSKTYDSDVTMEDSVPSQTPSPILSCDYAMSEEPEELMIHCDSTPRYFHHSVAPSWSFPSSRSSLKRDRGCVTDDGDSVPVRPRAFKRSRTAVYDLSDLLSFSHTGCSISE